MTIRTLGAGILCSLASAACSFGAVDNGLLALAPQNTQFVVGVNVIASRNSEIGQYLSTRFNADAKGLDQLNAATGFDPRRDLESVLFAGIAGPSGRQDNSGLLLARGTFDQSRIRGAALAKGAVVQNFSGVDIYLQSGNEHHKNAFAFLDTNVFATGSVAELQQAVANRLTPVTLDPKLQQLITQAGTDNDVWFASIISGARFAKHLPSDMEQSVGGSQTLQGVSAASGGLKFGSSVQLTVDAIARSAQDASSLADVLRFGAGLLQTKGQSDPHGALLSSALSQMLISASGQNVHLSLSIPEATLEQLAEVRSQHRLTH